jgi:flagellar biosynthesis/type III secretory pathway protein FliH
MSSPRLEQVRFWQPLQAIRLERTSPPPPTAAEIEARVREAFQKGYAEASTHINQQILEQRTEVNQLREQLFRSLEHCVETAVAEVRSALPVLTMAAVRRVLARTPVTRETVAGIVDELLAEIGPDVGPIELRLHPADLALVQDLEPQMTRIHPGLCFVGDEGLGRGDCQAVTRFGKVDARLQNKLSKLESSLAASS